MGGKGPFLVFCFEHFSKIDFLNPDSRFYKMVQNNWYDVQTVRGHIIDGMFPSPMLSRNAIFREYFLGLGDGVGIMGRGSVFLSAVVIEEEAG